MLRNNHQNQIFFLLSLPHFTIISFYNMVYHILLNVSKTMVLYKSFSESKNIFFCMCVLPFNPCPIKHTGQHICAFVWVNKMDIYQKAGFVHMHKDKRLICWPKRLLHIYKQHTYTHTQKKSWCKNLDTPFYIFKNQMLSFQTKREIMCTTKSD